MCEWSMNNSHKMLSYVIAVIVIAISASLIAFVYKIRCISSLSVPSGSRILFVIAHPDDETMFFSPTISHLQSIGHYLHFLCLTSGNFYGKGTIRKIELVSCFN